MRKLLSTIVLAALLLSGVAAAQYYYDPLTGTWVPYGYPAYAAPQGYHGAPGQYGAPAAYGVPGAYGMDPMAAMDAMGQQLEAQLRQQQAQLDVYQQQMDAQMAQLVRYFIDLYRTTTGDTASPDEVAYYYGQAIHCQRYPVDCQIAAQNSQASAQALAQQNAAWQARMQQQQAGFDAANQAWWDQQAANDQAHEDFMNGVIRGVDPFTNAAGQTQMLPFAPSQGAYYQTPAGNPLYFDPSFNVWYEYRPDGTWVPYYGQP